MSEFEPAFNRLLQFEGRDYVNDPSDRGGESKYGISKRAYPQVNIQTLTEEGAKNLYRMKWNEYQLSNITDQMLANKVFDILVNTGAKNMSKIVNRAIRAFSLAVDESKSFDAGTIYLLNSFNAHELVIALKCESAAYYRAIVRAKPAQAKFENGWLKRAYA